MSSQTSAPVSLSILERLRNMIASAATNRSYMCGLIRGLDIAIETFTRASDQLEPQQRTKQLQDRAGKVVSDDDYQIACATAMRMAGDLMNR